MMWVIDWLIKWLDWLASFFPLLWALVCFFAFLLVGLLFGFDPFFLLSYDTYIVRNCPFVLFLFSFFSPTVHM